MGASWLWWWRAPLASSSAIAFGFLASGAALAVDARERALHSSIRQLLNQQFGGFLIDSIGPACRHDPLLSRALLVEDASRGDGFVSLRADIVCSAAPWQVAMPSRVASRSASTGRPRRSAWPSGEPVDVIEAPITFRRPDSIPE